MFQGQSSSGGTGEARHAVLYRLTRALRRKANRFLDVLDGGARHEQRAMLKAQQRQAWRQTAKAQFQANAAALQSDPDVAVRLEEMIAARIGTPVRHIGSQAVPGGKNIRAHASRRAYTRHWLEISGTIDERLLPLCDADGQLAVFVKSAAKLRLNAPLEFILSEQRGSGFRAPYFFGTFTHGDLKIAAWEAIDTHRGSFRSAALEDQTRIVEAIAAANAVCADGTLPVLTRWVQVEPRWFESQYRLIDGAAHPQWQELHARTADVMRHQERLVRRLRSSDTMCLTHNDLRIGGNIAVPGSGDVVCMIGSWQA